MEKTLSTLTFILFTWILFVASISSAMAEASEKKSVHIVYMDRPEGEEPEAFHIKTLASAVGSEAAAKEAVIYHYTHAASGFSAKLTSKEAEELSKQPGVLQVTPDSTVQLHNKPARVGHMGLT